MKKLLSAIMCLTVMSYSTISSLNATSSAGKTVKLEVQSYDTIHNTLYNTLSTHHSLKSTDKSMGIIRASSVITLTSWREVINAKTTLASPNASFYIVEV